MSYLAPADYGRVLVRQDDGTLQPRPVDERSDGEREYHKFPIAVAVSNSLYKRDTVNARNPKASDLKWRKDYHWCVTFEEPDTISLEMLNASSTEVTDFQARDVAGHPHAWTMTHDESIRNWNDEFEAQVHDKLTIGTKSKSGIAYPTGDGTHLAECLNFWREVDTTAWEAFVSQCSEHDGAESPGAVSPARASSPSRAPPTPVTPVQEDEGALAQGLALGVDAPRSMHVSPHAPSASASAAERLPPPSPAAQLVAANAADVAADDLRAAQESGAQRTAFDAHRAQQLHARELPTLDEARTVKSGHVIEFSFAPTDIHIGTVRNITETDGTITVSITWDVAWDDAQFAVQYSTMQLFGPEAIKWATVTEPPPLVLRLGKRHLNGLWIGQDGGGQVEVLPAEGEALGIRGVFGVCLGKSFLAVDSAGAVLKEGKKFATSLGPACQMFGTSLGLASAPHMFDLFVHVNAATGDAKNLYLCLGSTASFDLEATDVWSTVDPFINSTYAVIGLPLHIFGRGFEDLKVGVYYQGRCLDLTTTSDAPVIAFQREQWPDLRMLHVDGPEHLTQILGASFVTSQLTSFLIKWRPLTALKEEQVWGPPTNVVAFIYKHANTPPPPPFTSLSNHGKALCIMAAKSLAHKHKTANEGAVETKMHVTKRLLDYTNGTKRFIDAVLMPNPALFQSTAPSKTSIDKLFRELDSYKPELQTTTERMRSKASGGVLEQSSRNSREAAAAAKRKSTHASPGQRRSLRTKKTEEEEEEEEEAENMVGTGEENEAPLNLATLLEQARNPPQPTASENSTLLAMHAAQTADIKSLQSALEAERTDHRRTLEKLATQEAELAAKRAELDGLQMAMQEFNRLRDVLQTKEGERAKAQSEADERASLIKELKKQQKMQQAAFLALANVNSQQYTAFLRDDDDD